jgi:uridylate kinase
MKISNRVNKKMVVLSLGGSLIVPDEIDTKFLKQFKKLIELEVKRGSKFIIITGGGKTCRKYNEAAKSICQPTTEDLDWMGIKSTILNAQLFRTIFREIVNLETVQNPTKKIKTNKPLLVGGGWHPGCSSDMDAVLVAKTYGVKKIVNLSNIDYAYDKDPKKFKDAKKIENISWKEFQKIVGDKWDPGLNAPFDPIASKVAAKEGLEVAILNGKKLANFKKYLDGEKFAGTTIK